MTEQPNTPELISTVECPQCDGDGGYIDDDNPDGWRICSYCDGKGIVSYSEAEEWQSWDENLGFDRI